MASHGSSFQKVFMGAAGTSEDSLNVEDVFSTFLYTGDTSADDNSQSLTTGIDLANEGGMLWIACRSAARGHTLVDTAQNTNLSSNSDRAGATSHSITTTSTGFTLGNGDAAYNNGTTPDTYVAWSFRKAPKFFDVVAYTGNGVSGREVAHNLGSVPGMIIVKRLDADSYSWNVYHRSLANTEGLRLNDSAQVNTSYQAYWNSTTPTSSVFTLGNKNQVNHNNATYVAYLFAHNDNDGGFGPSGDQDIIKCGSYTGNGSTTDIDLGFEPQFILHRRVNDDAPWRLYDVMRGLHSGYGTVSGQDTARDSYLAANTSAAEAVYNEAFRLTPTGFTVPYASAYYNQNGDKYIYIAIRKPNVATITDATKVFKAYELTGGTTNTTTAIDFPPDIILHSNSSGARYLLTRKLGSFNDGLNTGINGSSKRNWFAINQPNAFDSGTYGIYYKMNNTSMTGSSSNYGGSNIDNISSYHWKRAKSFLDVVCYTGTGSAKTEAHGLGVAPEMMWVKNRGVADPWAVYYGDNTDYLVLNTDAATVDNANWWNDTSPTSSVFTIGTDHSVNASGEYYIAYLFATLAGVSKVGTVSHSGSSTDVNCGFSNGARLVILKRTDAAGLWYLFDSVNGIVSGNDPYYATNETGSYGGVAHAAHITNTDFIDPLSSGFQISGDFTDGDYLFYAVA